MSEKTTLYPYQVLMAENNLTEADLPEAIKKKITKFNEETDEDKKTALDEKIFSDIDDLVEDIKAKAKVEDKKKKHAATQKKATDLSNIPTATDGDGKKGRSVLGRIIHGHDEDSE